MSIYAWNNTLLIECCDRCYLQTSELFVCIECGAELCGECACDSEDGTLCPNCKADGAGSEPMDMCAAIGDCRECASRPGECSCACHDVSMP
jgi:hypothetical protein